MQNNSIYFLSMMILLFIVISVTIAEDEPSILTKRDAFKMYFLQFYKFFNYLFLGCYVQNVVVSDATVADMVDLADFQDLVDLELV